LQQFPVRNGYVLVRGKIKEQVELFRRQPDLLAIRDNSPRFKIGFGKRSF